MELLEEAVTRARSGPTAPEKVDSAVEIPITAYFPTSYIADEETRVELYSRLARCSDVTLLYEIREECEDRFGLLPQDAEGLFTISRIRVLASQCGVRKVSRVLNHLRFEFVDNRLPDIGSLFQSGDSLLQQIYFEPKDRNSVNMNILLDTPDAVFADAEAFLRLLIQLREDNVLREVSVGNKDTKVLQSAARKLAQRRKNTF